MLAIISLSHVGLHLLLRVVHILHVLHALAARCNIYSQESIMCPSYIRGTEASVTARTSFKNLLQLLSYYWAFYWVRNHHPQCLHRVLHCLPQELYSEDSHFLLVLHF